jgi:hypothetical protein
MKTGTTVRKHYRLLALLVLISALAQALTGCAGGTLPIHANGRCVTAIIDAKKPIQGCGAHQRVVLTVKVDLVH